jgi:DNA-binding XRE family transcriptional regulator
METPVAYKFGKFQIRESTLKSNEWTSPVPDEIKMAMAAAGLNQSQLAKMLHVGKSTINSYVNGKNGKTTPMPFSSWAILCCAAGLGEIWKG